MFYYPWQKLLTDARNGDLFVGHLVQEARPLSDPLDQLGELRSSFRLRANYRREIEHASDLGWFIARFPHHLKPSLTVKRMVWCVRTILIAQLAEEGKLVFAPTRLAKLAGSKAATDLLIERRRRLPDDKMQRTFRRFLLMSTERQRWHGEKAEDYFIQRFSETSNEVALKALQQNTQCDSHTYA